MTEKLSKQIFEEEDIDLLKYQLEQINQELTWQFQIDQIENLKTKKKEIESKINKLKK